MRSLLAAIVLLCTTLAGCSGDGGEAAPEEPPAYDDIDLDVSDTTGAIVGVVVDSAIRPIVEAKVELVLESGRAEALTDDRGLFAFDGLNAGFYTLEVTKAGYKGAQLTAEVEAGVDRPPLVKIHLERLFSQDPYSEQFKLAGFLACGYSAVLISSPCVVDYTVLVVPGGAAPQINENSGNRRDLHTEVTAGWQSLVFELLWDPSVAGTAEQMGMTVSHPDRTSGHWYGSSTSGSPALLRIDVGEMGPNSQNDGSGEDMIPEEGKLLRTIVNARAASGGTPGLALNQEFEFFQTNFYFGVPPEGWSFLAGDAPPF